MDRRQITTGVTLMALCGLLALGAVWGWKSLFAEVPTGTQAAEETGPTCTTEQVAAGQRLRSSQVTVSVFNGGNRSGLADSTLAALEKRGFRPGALGNAPDGITVKRVQIWSTQENDPAAQLVARQFGETKQVRFRDEDLGPGVDVIVGNNFKGLVKAPRAVKLEQPEDVCVPVPSESSAPAADTNAVAEID